MTFTHFDQLCLSLSLDIKEGEGKGEHTTPIELDSALQSDLFLGILSSDRALVIRFKLVKVVHVFSIQNLLVIHLFEREGETNNWGVSKKRSRQCFWNC